MRITIPVIAFCVFLSGFLTAGPARAANTFPDFTVLVEKVEPVVVSILAESRRRGTLVGTAGGSGFVLSEDGYVLTNRHVVADADRVKVRLHNGKELAAEIIGQDAGTDVALLKIDAENLKFAKIGDVEKLKVGQWVLAFGAPFGFEQTVTAGIVSAKGRALGTEQYVPFIQSDVAINRGNSGGPLINMDGEVVGINSQILSATGGNIGLSFSIPMNLAMDIVGQLRDNGVVNRGYLGVGYQPVDYDLAKSFGLETVHGALINNVEEDAPADKAGLKAGDIVLKVDEHPIENYNELAYLVGLQRPGSKVKLEIARQGKRKTVTVKVGSRADFQPEFADNGGTFRGDNNLGMSVTSLSDDLRDATGIESGVVVRGVDPSGVAAESGIRPGDVIQTLNMRPVKSIADYNRILGSLPDSGSIAVLVTRPNQGSRFLTIDLGE